MSHTIKKLFTLQSLACEIVSEISHTIKKFCNLLLKVYTSKDFQSGKKNELTDLYKLARVAWTS